MAASCQRKWSEMDWRERLETTTVVDLVRVRTSRECQMLNGEVRPNVEPEPCPFEARYLAVLDSPYEEFGPRNFLVCQHEADRYLDAKDDLSVRDNGGVV